MIDEKKPVEAIDDDKLEEAVGGVRIAPCDDTPQKLWPGADTEGGLWPGIEKSEA